VETSPYLDVLAYAVVATLTPLGFAMTVAVIETGRLKALAFGVGFVSAQMATCAILVAVGASSTFTRDHDRPTFRAVLELVFGVALLAVAANVRRGSESSAASTNGRAHAMLDRLRRLRLVTAFAGGLLLGVGGPKRLVLTALAAASIATSGAPTSEQAALVVAYAIVATFLVWGPVIALELAGDRVVAIVGGVERWLRRHQRAAAFYAVVTVGLLAIADALRKLF
jgi:threonine/homoserine/homoserine lactone efflux protein